MQLIRQLAVVLVLAVLASLPMIALSPAEPAAAVPTGMLDTLAGAGATGQADGAAGTATFDSLTDLAVSPDGAYLYALERGTSGRPNQIRKISASTGAVTTFASGGLLDTPTDLEVDPSGDVWVAVKRPDVGGLAQEGIIRFPAAGGSPTVMLDGICCDYYNQTGFVGGAFAIDPGGAYLYYNFQKNDGDGNRLGELFRIPVSSLPANATAGAPLGAAGSFVRSSMLDMEFASDGNLYVIWDETGPGGGGYPPQMYRYNGGFTQIGGNMSEQRRLAFSQTTTSVYLPCNGCTSGQNTVVRKGGYGTGSADLMAGGASGFSDGTPGQMSTVTGIAVSPDGATAWLADQGNHRIRRIALPADPNLIPPSESNGPNVALNNDELVRQCVCDPIDLGTGNLHMPVPSMSVAGRGPGLAIDLGYNSSKAAEDSATGFGWASTLDMTIKTAMNGNEKTVVQETGATVAFAKDGSSWVAPGRFTATLTASGGGFVFTRNHFESFRFDSLGRLTEIFDQYGNSTTVHYPNSTSTQADYLEDESSRRLTLTWSGNRLATVTDPLTSGEGGPRVATFAYDGSGNLTTYRDISGGNWTFAYDTGHRMTRTRKPRHYPSGPYVETHYDAGGRADWQTDELGRKTTIGYDTPSPGSVQVTLPTASGQASRVNMYKYVDGRREEVTVGYGTADAVTTAMTFDPDTYALKSVKVGSKPATIYTDADGDGNVDYVKDPTNRYTQFTYNGFDQVVDTRAGASSATSTDGVVTHNEYDATTGRLEKTTSAQSSSSAVETVFSYDDANGHPDDVVKVSVTEKGTVVDSRVKELSYTYASGTGYQTSLQDPEGNRSTTTYNTIGWPLVQTTPKGVATTSIVNDYQTTYAYDLANRTTTVTGPEGDKTKTVLDANANIVSSATGITVSKPAGDVTQYGYTDADELQTVDPPGTGVRSYTYWPSGERKTYTNETGGVWTTTFDSAGQLAESKDPKNNVTVYDYGSAGELTTVRQPVTSATCTGTKVGCITYGYDDAGRVTSVDYSATTTPDVTSITYDMLGRRTHATSDGVTEDWSWNDLSQLTSHTDANAKTTSYTWDKVGNLKTITYPGHASTPISRTFDKAGRLAATTDFAGRTTTFGYDADSNWTGTVFPNTSSGTANTDVYGYDTAGRMTSATWWDGTTSGTKLGSETYTRDTSTKGMVKTTTPTGSAGTTARTNTYDTRDRLSTAGTESFGYDAATNLVETGDGALQVFDPSQRLCSSSPSGTSGTCTTSAADSTDYTYDNLANRTTAIDDDNNRRTHTYDQANRLVGVVDDNIGVNDPTSSLSDSLVVGDFDGDSQSDVLSYRAGGSSDDIMWWGAARSDFGRSTKDFNVTGSYTPLSGDFNGDGYHDIFWYKPGIGADPVWFWFGRHGGGYNSYTSTVDATDYTPFVGNFDGDTNNGHPIDDIYWYRDGTGADFIWFGDTGAAENNHTYVQDNENVSGTYRPVTGDFDGDGKDEIFWYGPGSTADSVWDFTSRTSHTTTYKTVSGADYVVDSGDWDGDGYDDVLFNDWTTNGGDTIWWGPGLSSSSSKSVSLATAQFTASSDFDGDGKDDMLVNKYNTGGDTIWWGSTKTNFSTSPTGFASGNAMVATYAYDADGLRKSKTVNGGTAQKFTWGAAGSYSLLLEQSSGSSVTSLIYGPGGQPVAQVEPDGTTRWLHLDQLGSVRLSTNATNGDQYAKVTYDAYGTTDTASGTQPLLGYAGQYSDTETGYQYLRARYYDPTTSQFLTVDPLVASTGEPYAYVSGNPMNTVDPSGLIGFSIGPVKVGDGCPLGKNPNGSCRGSDAANAATSTVKSVASNPVAQTVFVATACTFTGALGCAAANLTTVAINAGNRYDPSEGFSGRFIAHTSFDLLAAAVQMKSVKALDGTLAWVDKYDNIILSGPDNGRGLPFSQILGEFLLPNIAKSGASALAAGFSRWVWDNYCEGS